MKDQLLTNSSAGKPRVAGATGLPEVARLEPAPLPSRRAKGLVVMLLFLLACFAKPLYDLARYAAQSDLYSHVLLVPFISGYMVWLKKREISPDSAPTPTLGIWPLVAGVAVCGGYWLAVALGWRPTSEDYLSAMTLSFLTFGLSAAFLFVGAEALRRASFPLAFLVFTIPFPVAVLNWIETALQHGSAAVANVLFTLAGMPLLREGTVFKLPGITMEVAPECSGIHSTLVLFITSLLAGYLFLRSPWKRALLALLVIPLALLRNGFRVFTIGELCVNVSPDMIHSYIHRKGGPIFFVLSLVPFFFILLLLRRSELKSSRGQAPQAGLR